VQIATETLITGPWWLFRATVRLCKTEEEPIGCHSGLRAMEEGLSQNGEK